jgi:hypothetical protein
VDCPAEVPPTVSAFLTQQHRWNKGLAQTAIKLLPRILSSPAPLKTKIEAWFHLTSPLVHLAILLLAMLAAPLVLLPWRPESLSLSPPLALGIGVALIALGTLAACTFYIASQWAQGLGIWQTIARMPALMSLGIGISVINARAVVEAVLGRKSPFLRTPKYAGALDSASDPLLTRHPRRLPPGSIELALGLLMAVWPRFRRAWEGRAAVT